MGEAIQVISLGTNLGIPLQIGILASSIFVLFVPLYGLKIQGIPS